MKDLFSFCLACGSATEPSLVFCDDCGQPLAMDDPERDVGSRVLSGTVKTSEGSRLSVALRLTPSVTLAFPAGTPPVNVEERSVRRLAPVSGAEAFQSSAAAVLAAATRLLHPPDSSGWAGSTWLQSVATRLLEGRPLAVRRAAYDLARLGFPEPITALSLGETEQKWWRALALARSGRRSDAASLLLELPVGRYPDATALAYALGRHYPTDRAWAERVVEARLPADPVARAAAAVAGAPRAGERVMRWAVKPTYVLTNRYTVVGDVEHRSRDTVAVLEGFASPTDRRIVPASASLSVIDELVEGGAVEVDLDSVPSLTAQDRLYLRARSNPETLTDTDLAVLGHSVERLRRKFLDGGSVTSDEALTGEPWFDAIVEFRRSGTILPALREALGSRATALDAYLSAPGPDALNDYLLEDRSLWGLLADRYPNDQDFPSYPRGSVRGDFAAFVLLRRALAALLDAEFEDAVSSAKDVLRLSETESIRDEALNLLACAQWQLGHSELAVHALRSALAGAKNSALQVNLGIVASDLEPEAAALELARLVNESPTLELRVAAALKAHRLWKADMHVRGSAVVNVLPGPIRDALRSIVIEWIDLDAFRQIMKLLANYDEEWLRNPNSLRAAAHRHTVEARVYCALATGWVEYATALGQALKESPTSVWINDERDLQVAQLIREAKELADEIEEEEAEPADQFMEIMIAFQPLTFATDFQKPFVIVWNALVAKKGIFAMTQLNELRSLYEQISNDLAGIPPYRRDKAEINRVVQPLVDVCCEITASLRRVHHHSSDVQLREALMTSINFGDALATVFRRLIA